jgi:uncharacterized membrane protein YhdT
MVKCIVAAIGLAILLVVAWSIIAYKAQDDPDSDSDVGGWK